MPSRRYLRRPAVAMLAVAACLGIVGAVPSSAHLVAAEPIGAVTTVTATTSGTADVVLYDDATLSPRETHNPDVSISGPGRVVGFTLSRTDEGGDLLMAVRMPTFAGGLVYVDGSTTPTPVRCTESPSPLQANGCPPEPKPKAILLHEGYYRLAVLTDGKPLRITLHLHGLARTRANVRLQAKVRTAEADLPARESVGSTTITYGADTANAGAKHVAMLVRATLHQNATLLAQSECARQDSGAPPPYAFSPACPGGSSDGIAWESNNSVRQEFGAIGGLSVYDLMNAPLDPTGIGGSYVDTDGPAYVGGIGIWSWSDDLDFFSADLWRIAG